MGRNWSEHRDAHAELRDAVYSLEKVEPGLGAELTFRVEQAIDDILDIPHAWPRVRFWDKEPHIHYRSIKLFRYQVLYYISGDAVRVIAYAHERRAPLYWKERVAK